MNLKDQKKCNDEYQKLFNEISETYIEEAKPLISDEKINSALENEKKYIEKAKNTGISPMSIVNGNTAKYCKDMLRKDQPLHFIYYILSLFTQISYLMLICVAIKCTILYFTGHNNAFSANTHLSYIPYLITLYFVSGDIIHHVQRKSIINGTKSHKTILRIISAILAAGGCMIIYIITGTRGIFTASLPVVFLITVAMLFLSGIHNVIYSSQFVSFFTIGFMTITRKPADEVKNVISDYISKSSQKSDDLKVRLKTDRIYCFIGAFIAVILDIVCIKQLVNKITMPLIIFCVASLIITLLLVIAFISCRECIRYISSL